MPALSYIMRDGRSNVRLYCILLNDLLPRYDSKFGGGCRTIEHAPGQHHP